MSNFSQALNAIRLHGLGLITNSPDVHAVGVGLKTVESIAAAKGDDFSITAVVTEKRATRRLTAAGLRPFADVYQREAKGTELESVETDVIESGGPYVLHQLRVRRAQRGFYGGSPPVVDTQGFFSSLRSGISITNPRREYPNGLSAGTLGSFLRDNTGTTYLLSNNHVIGQSDAGRLGDPVVQPGTLDLTVSELNLMRTMNSLVGNLGIAELSAMVPIQRATPSSIPLNRVDAAIARLTASGRALTDLARLSYAGAVVGVAAPVDEATAPTRVYKVGRTTGFTEGEIDMLGVLVPVPYPGGTGWFQDQISVRATADNGGPFSDRGDSGSIVLNDQHKAVGLLFAGTSRSTVINPIDAVLQEMGNRLGRQLQLVT